MDESWCFWLNSSVLTNFEVCDELCMFYEIIGKMLGRTCYDEFYASQVLIKGMLGFYKSVLHDLESVRN